MSICVFNNLLFFIRITTAIIHKSWFNVYSKTLYLLNILHPHPRLPIMAVLTKGLPVCFVPEKPHIPAMGHNVVHHSRRSQFPSPSAFRT